MFLTYLDEALEVEKFKRAGENKIEFDYDYRNLNASYVNEKINFADDYFQEIINPFFEKIDSLFQQTSLLKPYIPTVILEKVIINLEDEIVSLLEKEKEHMEIIESLKSKGFESCESEISELENQNENECQEVEKGCDNLENSNVIAPGILHASSDMNVVHAFDYVSIKTFLGTVPYSHDDLTVIASYGHVGLGVAFQKYTCFVRTEEGVDLLTGDRSSNLYTIALNDIASNSSIYFLAMASSSQFWFWHQQEYSSSSLHDDDQQRFEEVMVPSSNTQSVTNDIVPNVDEASTSHNFLPMAKINPPLATEVHLP
ncbi:hypothetical protein Tco_0507930 [Tanacetum coccineum]